MPLDSIHQDLTERALMLSMEAFTAGLYAAAFYALQAALDGARLLPDDSSLTEVGRIAADMSQQLRQLSAAAPRSRISLEAQHLDADLDFVERQVATLLHMRSALRWTGPTDSPRS